MHHASPHGHHRLRDSLNTPCPARVWGREEGSGAWVREAGRCALHARRAGQAGDAPCRCSPQLAPWPPWSSALGGGWVRGWPGQQVRRPATSPSSSCWVSGGRPTPQQHSGCAHTTHLLLGGHGCCFLLVERVAPRSSVGFVCACDRSLPTRCPPMRTTVHATPQPCAASLLHQRHLLLLHQQLPPSRACPDKRPP